MSTTYKPTEHHGLKEDGTIDQRVGTGVFAQGKVDPHEAGLKGAEVHNAHVAEAKEAEAAAAIEAEGEKYKPTEHGGRREDGKPDHRVKGN